MKQEKEIDFRSRPLVFIDVETTGLDFRVHEIIEIVCLVVESENLKITLEYGKKVRPEHIETADPKALAINGYSENDWRDARPLGEVLKEISDIAPGGMLAGWNISYDWGFLQEGFRRFGITPALDYHKIDVMSMAYAALHSKKKPKGLSLVKVAPSLGINIPTAHRAKFDIYATYEVFKKLMGRVDNK